MLDDWFGDPERDASIGDALRRLGPATSLVGDDALRARIQSAAQGRLSRLRDGGRPWWEWTASWARIALPVGVAASLAAATVLLGTSVDPNASTTGTADTLTPSGIVLNAVAGAEPGGDVAGQLVAEASDEWLLTRVMSR